MNLSLAEADVVGHCKRAGVAISAIETLASGGTHLVCITGDDAETMRRRLRDHLIEGRVQRFAFAHARQPRPAAEPAGRGSDSPWRRT
jgi:hypothetical protein